jgi:FtsH-binding integral membrane protein
MKSEQELASDLLFLTGMNSDLSHTDATFSSDRGVEIIAWVLAFALLVTVGVAVGLIQPFQLTPEQSHALAFFGIMVATFFILLAVGGGGARRDPHWRLGRPKRS